MVTVLLQRDPSSSDPLLSVQEPSDAPQMSGFRGLRRSPHQIRLAMAQTPIAARLERLVTSASHLRVLGLDINTTSTGYAVLNGSGASSIIGPMFDT